VVLTIVALNSAESLAFLSQSHFVDSDEVDLMEEGKPFRSVQCYYSHWFIATVGRVFSDLPRPVAYYF